MFICVTLYVIYLLQVTGDYRIANVQGEDYEKEAQLYNNVVWLRRSKFLERLHNDKNFFFDEKKEVITQN